MVDHLKPELAFRQEIDRLWRAVRALGNATPLASSSIGRGGIRIYDGGIITVENGGISVIGWIDVSGEIRIAGTLRGTGDIVWTGDASFSGDTTIGGNLDVTGATAISGTLDVTGATTLQALVTLLNDLRVQGGGKITITGGPSPITLQNGTLSFGTGAQLDADGGGARLVASGGSGPRAFAFPGSVGMQHSLGHSVIVTGTQTTIEGGLQAFGNKSFVMEPPTKPGKLLRHGSTESPVSGIEYWGEAELDDDGNARVELPEYFEALAKPKGRIVLVSPVDELFWVAASRIKDGAFTAKGQPGGTFSWLVKAERYGGDFDLESDIDANDLTGTIDSQPLRRRTVADPTEGEAP
ncbi:hypothetical protein [Agromyces humatus]|uniref:Polymer-forming cytoskeletal protein n=1 Tax=Agromyces humatus TaxID=279573 RepID=A0ABP4X5Q2_9MICO|nr:hypothetical protein [Agromyces humatus]